MPKLIIIAGTKGGIGKTFVATLLCDVALKAGKKVVLFDCDDENHTLQHIYGETESEVELINIAVETDGEHEDPLDEIVNAAIRMESGRNPDDRSDTIYIADMKAGTSIRTVNWMEVFPFDLFLKMKIEFLILGVVTSDLDSAVTFAYWVRSFTEAARKKMLRIAVVKNDFQVGNFAFFQQKLEPFLQKIPETAILEMNGFGEWTFAKLRSSNASIGQILDSKKTIPKFGIMGDVRCGTFFRHAQKIFLPLLAETGGNPPPVKKQEGGDK